MAINAKNLLISLVVKAYGVTNEKAAEIINDADENLTDDQVMTELLALDKTRVKTLQTNSFNEGHKKAKGEVLAEFEQTLRDKYEISDTSLKGADLIESVVQSQNKQDGNTKPLTDDAVKKHPLYIQLQDEKKAAVKKVTDEYTAKLNEVETGYKKKDTLSYAEAEATRLFDGLNPILPADAKLAANQKRLFIKGILDGNQFERQGDRMVILDAEGKVKEDGHGNAITFEDYVKNNASEFFSFKQTDVGGGAGNRNEPGGSGSGSKKFKNEDEYMDYVSDTTKPLADRQAAAQEWEAAQKGE